jgi:glycosyltransferase involved in cell wall biosynthesis
MSATKPPRVMWLLNHTTLRQFEMQQLKNLGVTQIYTPKKFPYDEGNLSASVTYEFDNTLNLSPSEIELLNAQDWYENPESVAWDIANKNFDVVFIGFFPRQVLSASRNFKGAIVLRGFGLGGEETYSKLIRQIGGAPLQYAISRAGKRFWFGMAYGHLADCEDSFIADQAVFMPIGLKSITVSDKWEGDDRLVFFVCPRIGSSSYFNHVYENFRRVFEGIPYRIGGAQPIAVSDPNVLGFVSNERYAEVMTKSRVMYYHSQEPNHIHYHPFEAIRAGMPLVFMAGGMLDRMGGRDLPGRCRTTSEARQKVERILSDDWKLIEALRTSQTVLLEPMKPENCEPAWREGFTRIASEMEAWRSQQVARPKMVQRKKVAVVLPVGYRGGRLRAAMALAKALYLGSRQCGEDADVVFVHLDDPATYPDGEFADLPDNIARRAFNWKILPAAESRRAMRYAGFQGWEPTQDCYIAPDDGMRQLMDCDLWLIVSDRLSHPPLPLRPVVLVVYDYLQRYVDLLSHGADMAFLNAARHAAKVLVTTKFTQQDAIQYAGVDPSRVCKVPMLAPEFPIRDSGISSDTGTRPFFLWTTNAALHKNHLRAAEALQIYYEELGGGLDCKVTGVNTKEMLASDLPHLRVMAEFFQRSKPLRKHVKWRGELPDVQYRRLLSKARFLWHAGRIDNGTFSVIEAACLGVPSLSSDYPAMREIDEQFSLNLVWMNPECPREMAERLKRMEVEAKERRKFLPGKAKLEAQRIEQHAKTYWQEVRSCL